MLTPSRTVLGAALLVSLGGCSHAAASRSAPGSAGSSAVTVIGAEQLRGASSSLLGALRTRIAGLEVRSTRSVCPEITLRGQHSLLGDNSPVVYVNGTRAANTCVLEMLLPIDVERVEVYRMGVAPKPPYKAHPNGLILVFLESGLEN